LPDQNPSKYFSDAFLLGSDGIADFKAILAASFAHAGASFSTSGKTWRMASSRGFGSGGGPPGLGGGSASPSFHLPCITTQAAGGGAGAVFGAALLDDFSFICCQLFAV
jgi:hypothetical protein